MKEENKISDDIKNILKLVDEKFIIDKKRTWSQGSKTYLNCVKGEIKEVEDEILKKRKNHLEDELGDILWSYLNLLKNLQEEKLIDMKKVFERCSRKYAERIFGIERGDGWDEIKEKQKKFLEKEK